MGPKSVSAGGYNTAFKVQAEVSLLQQVKMRLSLNLGQLIV